MSYFSVQKEIEFDAGHRVPLHASKCSNPHGHRYRIVATVAGYLQEEGSSTGMVIDFSEIKKVLTELVHDVYDHGFIIQSTDQSMMDAFSVDEHGNANGWKIIVVDWTPTAEEMARAIYENLIDYLPGLVSIDVYETPTSKATFPYVGKVNNEG